MTFSILIPVFNVERYLTECLNSIVKQFNNNFEIIIVNDGSTDNSLSIIEKYRKKYSFIKVIDKQNEGLLSARRIALKKSKGEYIIFVDSDDFIEKNMLSELTKIIEEHKDIDVLCYGAYKLNRNNKKIHKGNVFSEGYISKQELIEKLLTKEMTNSLCTKMIRRSCIDIEEDYKNDYDVQLGEDLFQLLPIIKKATKFYYTTKNYYNYRTNNHSITKKYSKKDYNSIKKVNKLLDKYNEDFNITKELLYIHFYNDVLEIIKQIGRANKETDKQYEIQSIRNDEYFINKIVNNYHEPNIPIKKANKLLVKYLVKQKYIKLRMILFLYKYYSFIKNV